MKIMPKIVLNGFDVPIQVGRQKYPIRVGRGGGKCIQTADVPSVLNQSVAKHDNTVVFLHSHQCPHCRQTIPLIEEKCQDAKQAGVDVNFVECPTNFPHCNKILNKVKSDGVPTTLLVKKNKKVAAPAWKVIGADLANLNQRFGKLGLKGGSQETRPTAPQHAPPQAPPQPGAVRFGTPSPTQNLIKSLFPNTPPLAGIPQQSERSFCLPSYDKQCTPQQFNQDLANIFAHY